MKRIKTIRLFFIMVLLIISVVFVTSVFCQQFKQQLINAKIDTLESIDQRQQSAFFEINNFPTGIADDVLFLSKLSDWQEIINNPKKIENIKNDFLKFLSKSESYYQISYINKKGEILVMAESDGKTSKVKEIVDEDKDDGFLYLDLLKKLKNEEVYIFPIGLELSPKRISVLKYGTAIFDNKTNELNGILLVKVYADYFLDDIRRSLRDGETTYLINANGLYLANPRKTKEFGSDNFFNDYPNVSKDIVSCKNRRAETDKEIFTYRCINPTIGNFEIYNGSKTIDGADENSYQWLLITVTEKNSLENFSFKGKSIWWVVITQVMINSLIFILIFLNEKK